MSLRKLAVFCGLVTVAVAVSEVGGQAPPRPQTLTERVSAFGRGITGGSNGPQQQAAPTAADDAQGPRSAFPQVDGRSLLPNNMFGRAPQAQASPHPSTERAGAAARPATQPTTSNTTNTSNALNRPSANTSNRTAPATAPATAQVGDRYATRPRTSPAVESQTPADSSTSSPALPGLGGSPVPSFGGETANAADDSSNQTPVVEPFIPIEAPRSSAGSSRPSPAAARPSDSAARQSPQRRAPLHVDASELRHELAGSFPTAAGDAAKPAGEPSAQPSAMQLEPEASSSDAISTLPATDGTGAKNLSITPVPEPLPASRSTAPAREEIIPLSPAAEPMATPITPPAAKSFTSPAAPIQTIPTQPLTSSQSTNARRSSATPAPKQSSPASLNDPNLLVTNRTPIITSDIRGPKQILVGREATFRVRLQNQGDAPAEGVEVAIRVPSWADVIETTASSGSVTQAPGDAKGLLHWQLTRVEARGSEAIDVKLIPRGSRPLELGVTWTLAPVGSRAIVEVQEPKVEMNVAGPDEVLFGKPQLYRFTISNPGTGIAEGVKIELYPPGGSDKAAASNPLPDLLPGKSQTIEVELVAREAGKLRIKAVASAAGELTSEAIKEVFCRKPELALDWRGPEMKYAGTEATYFLRVRNPGTAPAEDVTVRATLPEGAQFTSASEGQSYDATRREIAWRVGSLAPGNESFMELKCTVNTPGANQLKFEAATASGDLADKKLIETKVVALGDLKLDVTDPSGPVAVGDTAVYEIRVQNRGASAAKDINIVGLFSAGVEPEVVDGAQYTVSNGRVAFRPIDELPAGRQVTLKIRAKAAQPGTHVFRAEVLCRELEIKLAAEETTRFYADDSGDSQERQATNTNGNGFEVTR